MQNMIAGGAVAYSSGNLLQGQGSSCFANPPSASSARSPPREPELMAVQKLKPIHRSNGSARVLPSYAVVPLQVNTEYAGAEAVTTVSDPRASNGRVSQANYDMASTADFITKSVNFAQIGGVEDSQKARENKAILEAIQILIESMSVKGQVSSFDDISKDDRAMLYHVSRLIVDNSGTSMKIDEVAKLLWTRINAGFQNAHHKEAARLQNAQHKEAARQQSWLTACCTDPHGSSPVVE